MKDVWQLGSSCVRDLGLYAVIIANDEMLNGEADDIFALDGISQIHNKTIARVLALFSVTSIGSE